MISEMITAQKRRSAFRAMSAPCAAPPLARGVEPICLYGWDSRAQVWYGPFEPACCRDVDGRLLRALRAATGTSWYGSINCGAPGETPAKFFLLVHDLSDCAVASIYCDESKTGPAEIVAVIPAHRRPSLRADFAFEFLAYAHFLGCLDSATELQVHDSITSALVEQPASTVAFAISSGLWPSDLDHILSCCVEKTAITLSRWMEDSESLSPS